MIRCTSTCVLDLGQATPAPAFDLRHGVRAERMQCCAASMGTVPIEPGVIPMRHLIPLSVTTLVLAGLFALPVAAWPAHDDVHVSHAAHATQAPAAAAPARQWPTDASLREGMRRIRVAVRGLEHYEHGHMGIAQASAAVTLVDEAIAGMFADCKLEADADVALHGLLAEFIAGAEAVRTSPQVPMAKIARMRQALARYPQLFDDPRWDADAAVD